MYKYKDKFEIVGADFQVEILGVFPGGQQRQIMLKDTSYKICLNGIEVDIIEKNLELLRHAGKAVDESLKVEIIEPLQDEIPKIVKENEEVINTIEPKKRGRKKGSKNKVK